jgi:hypothetical protein
VFEIQTKMFAKIYSPSEHLAVEEVLFFKKTLFSNNTFPRNPNCFGIKIYKTSDETVHTYDMTVYCLLIDTNSTQQRLVCLVSDGELTET